MKALEYSNEEEKQKQNIVFHSQGGKGVLHRREVIVTSANK